MIAAAVRCARGNGSATRDRLCRRSSPNSSSARARHHAPMASDREERAALRSVLSDMRRRCYSPNRGRQFTDWGGRGITVCDEWMVKRKGADAFIRWARGAGWKPGLSIDRIDNDQGYSPGNCRWIPLAKQMRNRRDFKRKAHPFPRGVDSTWRGRYRATIRWNGGKRLQLGSYGSELEASFAYEWALALRTLFDEKERSDAAR